ncbi:hypothetical protein [Enterobacter kobei]|uniref:hypothetical protein n=1 Tax=Enterobacter kobei TaxID=208224 RepID=UPI0006668011|nr:hypothetical protein [Enterobacter kobei]
MGNYTNQANVIQRISFDGFAIIRDKRATRPIGVLLAAAKPNEQGVSALKQRYVLYNIITFLRFDNAG